MRGAPGDRGCVASGALTLLTSGALTRHSLAGGGAGPQTQGDVAVSNERGAQHNSNPEAIQLPPEPAPNHRPALVLSLVCSRTTSAPRRARGARRETVGAWLLARSHAKMAAAIEIPRTTRLCNFVPCRLSAQRRPAYPHAKRNVPAGSLARALALLLSGLLYRPKRHPTKTCPHHAHAE